MATDIVIPNVGESVTEGVIAAWLKKDGDYVEQDETVLELETDKVTMEVPAPAAGVIKTSASEGDTVEVGAVVGSIDESAEKPSGGSAKGEQKSEASEGGSKDKAEGSSATSTAEKQTEKPADKQADKPADKQTSGEDTQGREQSGAESGSSASQPAAATSDAGSNGEVHATPLARKIAEEYRVDLSSIVGTGAGHRIREQDVLAAVQSGQTGKRSGDQADSGEAPTGGPSRATKRERMTPLRQRIATRLVEAQQTAAMLTTFNEVDMGAVMDLRKRYKEPFSEKHGVNLGFMSFFVKATVSALRAYPLINAYIVNDESGKPAIQTHDYCDIAMAVSSPKGLVVPVLRNCETLSFADIEKGVKDLAVRARDGKIDLSEMQGGTFTITNGGIFGSLMSTPILNPPQSGILGMHAIKNRPAEDLSNPGQVAMRPMMYLALSYDHRIVDGAEAVRFLVHIKECIEDPSRLLLGA